MTLDEKVEGAKAFFKSVLETYNKPVVMSSFGKDSMCLLHLLKTMGIKLPILFHRKPFEPKKYEFADSVIHAENYTVHDYPPSNTSVTKNGDKAEITSYYQVGGNATIWLGRNIIKPEDGKPFLCGLEDFYDTPIGAFHFPWDVCIVGHKSSDVDPIQGPVPLKSDIHHPEEGPDYAYPLRYFTDADVWEYTYKFKVPYNDKRYDKSSGYKEFKDKTYNDDYYCACMRCIDKDESSVVFCPKYNKQVSNISSTIRYKDIPKFSYIDN